jgi:hypothetical protein
MEMAIIIEFRFFKILFTIENLFVKAVTVRTIITVHNKIIVSKLILLKKITKNISIQKL